MQFIVVGCCDDFHAPIAIQICCHGRWQDIYVLQKSTVLVKRVVPALGIARYFPLLYHLTPRSDIRRGCWSMHSFCSMVTDLIMKLFCFRVIKQYQAFRKVNAPSCCIVK